VIIDFLVVDLEGSGQIHLFLFTKSMLETPDDSRVQFMRILLLEIDEIFLDG
jgi:hypothetical protein